MVSRIVILFTYQHVPHQSENDWNPGTWVLIWEYSMRAIQWIPTWQGLDDFQKSFSPCPLDESSLSIERVMKVFPLCERLIRRSRSLWWICSLHFLWARHLEINRLAESTLLGVSLRKSCIQILYYLTSDLHHPSYTHLLMLKNTHQG